MLMASMIAASSVARSEPMPEYDDIYLGVFDNADYYIAKADKRQRMLAKNVYQNVGAASINGAENTALLVDAGVSPAADYCVGLGYHFPSDEELEWIIPMASTIDAQDDSGGTATFAGMVAEYVLAWTSKEHGTNTIKMLYRYINNNGWGAGAGNGLECWVIPVRRVV